MKRKAFVAGRFYPGSCERLRETIAGLTASTAVRKKAIAVVSPHAGYVYSGPVAGAVFSSTLLPSVFIILGPGHREIGSLFAIQVRGSWQTPLGESPIERDLAARILAGCALVEENDQAHLWEHSLEVQLPFIQYFREDAAIVPICVSHEAGYGELETLGRALAEAVRDYGKGTLLVASTDMSHYVSQKTAEKKDTLAIRKILDLDPAGLFETVTAERISMCGFQPTAAALVAALGLGASGAELVRYQTSGETTGDYAQVVGYAGIRIF
ncbi:MAG: AmmeMemoRadiSam system protein B [Candidatus Aminicenantes bacterium RBG_16_63_14]|nr:MAG: AmmeMemoRadiSam system protein B [Candidatus Aminicenantes bacterium RBG_16_63_14]